MLVLNIAYGNFALFAVQDFFTAENAKYAKELLNTKHFYSFEIKMVYMISHARRKVKEGKLVKVELEYDNVVKRIKITGDFFMHPEDALEKIEESMLGAGKDESVGVIASKIQRAMNAQGAEMIGISPQSLAFVIKEALK